MTILTRKAIIVAITIITALGITFFLGKYSKKDIVKHVIKIEKVIQYKDKEGTTHSNLTSEEVTIQDLKDQLDSIKVVASNKLKPEGVTVFVPLIDTVFIKIPIKRTNNTISFTHNDSYLKAAAIANLDSNTGSISVSTIDTITSVNYTKKYLLKANEEVIDITNKNPYNKIVSGESIHIKQSKAILTFGPSITYSPFLNKPVIGVSATINIWSLKIK